MLAKCCPHVKRNKKKTVPWLFKLNVLEAEGEGNGNICGGCWTPPTYASPSAAAVPQCVCAGPGFGWGTWGTFPGAPVKRAPQKLLSYCK